MQISELSVRRPVFATVISLVLIIIGLVSLQRLSVREYPDVERPVVSISTTYRGASARVVENKITQPIEDRIAGIEGILKIESSSEDERSQITIEFDVNRDLDGAANDVRDRVSRVLGALPEEADPPEIAKATAGGDAVAILNFSSDKMSLLEISDYAERYIVDRIATVPGVARVSLSGGRRFAMRIWLSRQALAARELTVADVEAALRRENVQLPAGRLESQTREFSLRTEVGLDTEQNFRDLVIGRGAGGHLIRLGEVADVRLAAENERTVMRTEGRPGVGLFVEAQSKSNTLDVVRGVRAEVAALQGELPEGGTLLLNVDNALSIEAALREVVIAVIFAFISVLIVIYGFLGNLRATLIPAVTIPVSVIAAFTVMYALGYSVNVLTLLGLVLAIGLVVDDAIVVLENIHRRNEMGEPPMVAAVTGGREIGFAVIATTLVLAAVFVPISFLPGDIGRLFREFGFTLAAAVLFSALIALTLTPMLASKLPDHHAGRSRVAVAIDGFFKRLATRYEGGLRRAVRHPWIVTGSLLALSVLGVLTFRTIPTEFAPTADTGRLFLTLQGPEGASLQYTEAYGRRMEEIANEHRRREGEVLRTMLRIPGTGGGTPTTVGDVSSSRGIIVLEPWNERDRSSAEIMSSLLAELRTLPGVRAFGGQPSSLGRGGFGQPVQAIIGGPDYEQLSQWSQKIAQLAEQNPGLTGVDTDYKERKPQIRVAIDRNRAADLGVSLETVGRTLETVLGSRIVTTYLDRGREYNVILQGQDAERRNETDLTSIYVRSGRTNELIPLSNVVTLTETAGAIRLNRFNRLRSIEVSAGLAPGYTMGEAVQWFRDTVEKELPAGAKLMFDGESAEFTRSGSQLYLTFAFALAIVFLVLAAQFESFVLPSIIMVTVPLALLGAVFGLKLYGGTINIFSQIAVIMLIGIAAKNGVLIVEFANQLRDRGVEYVEAVIQAAATRLRPVLMTSLCTAFGALPFVFAHGAGAEQRLPIGVVVFFGTLVSMFLTLVAVPVVYSLVAAHTKSPEHTSSILDRLMSRPQSAAAPGLDQPKEQ
ncbi:multidrug efflux pump [Povalibacter uvarum]|uniref:Multidrug efflux pump n=1 Tax=Povalibacter uvarum TaxID=732238 RepID=A0A841HXG2_9GAMM|nr:efflux RND transporter permease subunit [Povalibacter uvarum]MBB6096485.1 multidrug efflux pump [Povalibacter uvarum]